MGHIGMRSDSLEQILKDDLVDGYGDNINFVNFILSTTTADRYFCIITGQYNRTEQNRPHAHSIMTFDDKSC